MRIRILNKDSFSLSGGTKTKQLRGNVWISEPGSIFGSRSTLVRKDSDAQTQQSGPVSQGQWKPLVWEVRRRSLGTKAGVSKSQGRFESEEM